jgi:hypothetical protein
MFRRLCDYFVTLGSRPSLARAKARLDRLALYPEPVDIRGVRIVVAPWLFAVPGFRRFRGYATRHLILLRGPGIDDDLVVHELCHVWQLQHRALRVCLSYEREARYAVESTTPNQFTSASPTSIQN